MFFGYQTHKKSVDYLNFFLVEVYKSFGNNLIIWKYESIQKMFRWFCVEPSKYVWYYCYDLVFFDFIVNLSARRSWKSIPSVSLYLRHGGSVLIDRKIPNKPFRPLKDWLNISKNTIVQLLFSGRNTSKTGVPKAFSQTGENFCKKCSPRHTSSSKYKQFLENS
jgi:1-acyl-sn-glycerol-3-phosphate acyltransferase